VPAPPPPFPPPPSPVPPPPAIVPGATRAPARTAASLYHGGTYAELSTEPITSHTGGFVHDRAVDRAGSITGHLLSREVRQRRERRRRLRTTFWVAAALLLFGIAIAVIVVLLAGDFLGGLLDTLSRWAG
jgi:hypothetical protein